MKHQLTIIALGSLLLLSSKGLTAQAIDATIVLGDRFEGVIDVGGDEDFLTFESAKNVTATFIVARNSHVAGGGALLPSLDVIDLTSQATIASKQSTGKKAVIKNVYLPTTGSYLVRIYGASNTTGQYRLKTKGRLLKSASRWTIVSNVAAGESLTTSFDGDASIVMSAKIRPSKNSSAVPDQPTFAGPVGAISLTDYLHSKLPKNEYTIKKLPLNALGPHVLDVSNKGGDGGVAVRVKLRKLKAKPQTYKELGLLNTELSNTKSGISVSLSGSSGVDWAVESTYHDSSIGDDIIYIRSPTVFSLSHNSRNSIVINTPSVPHVIGSDGQDTLPNTGDEGDIYYKIDRDLQASLYSTSSGPLPSYCVKYEESFTFESLTYDGILPVLGNHGDNGGIWGVDPQSTTDRYYYGQLDDYGNEWHGLTYWDDDNPMLVAAGVAAGDQSASDGHMVAICINPITPIIQLSAELGDEFYTTPIKLYHIPKIWPQTSYVSDGVRIVFVNLTNTSPIEYRIDNGQWQNYDQVLLASELIPSEDTEFTLQVRCGPIGKVMNRTIIRNPSFPSSGESHGNLLWADTDEKQVVTQKLKATQPFKKSYETLDNEWYQRLTTAIDDTRGEWRSGSVTASTALNNAFVMAIDGPESKAIEADRCKERLIRLARVQPIGNELDIDTATPSKDFMCELGQTLQAYADAGVAYDLLAAHYRNDQQPNGMSPIEDLLIRDGLAKIATYLLKSRSNYSATSGPESTHWALGFEMAIGIIALSMPTYSHAFCGVSGGDLISTNDLSDAAGYYWNPFPNQGVTWYDTATDSRIPTPGYPNVTHPFRSEFIITDDGYWSGANDLYADGNRYFTGPVGYVPIGVNYGGLANAEARVELMEMDGYEAPFVSRIHAFDYMRRIKNDSSRPLCITNYIRRRLVAGYAWLSWDAASKVWGVGDKRFTDSIYAFNPHYSSASLPSTMSGIQALLTNVNVYYGYESGTLSPSKLVEIQQDRQKLFDPYALALCADPLQMPPPQSMGNNPPIVKPIFKYVVRPGESVRKAVIAMDPDDDVISLSVQGLPVGAVFDQATRYITWTPAVEDAGVHIVSIVADDGQAICSRPFIIIVKPGSPGTSIPAPPQAVMASSDTSQSDVQIDWQAPSGVDVACYLIYRDGVLWATVPASIASYLDSELHVPGQNTRYHVALLDSNGAESVAQASMPPVVGSVSP